MINCRTQKGNDGPIERKLYNHQDDCEKKQDVDRCTEKPIQTMLCLRLSKCALAVAFILIAYDTITLVCLEPMGYIVNIYSIMPAIYFPSLILCFSIACFLIPSQSPTVRKTSVFLLFITLFAILIVPYALGYFSMGRADEMSYIGEYLHISKTGIISGWDIYPASPIIGASIAIITGLEVNMVSFIIPIVFSLIFVVGLYSIGASFFNSQIYLNILLVSSAILYLGSYNFFNTPHALFFAFIPIYLFILIKYIKSNDISFSITAITISLLIPFTHPFIFLFVFILLLFLYLLRNVVNELIIGDFNRLKNLIFIQTSTFFAWFIYSSTLLGSFTISIRAFLLRATEPVLNETSTKIVDAGMSLPALTTFLFIYYGRYIIPSLIVLLCTIVYYKRIHSDTHINKGVKFLLVASIIALFVEFILFINPIFSHQPDRMTNLMFFVYFLVPLFALSLYIFSSEGGGAHRRAHRHTVIRKTIIAVVVIITFGLSLYGALPSPNICKNNAALTTNEVDGMDWVYEFKSGQNMSSPLSQIGRFHALFDDGVKDNYIGIPDHFGYNESTVTFSETVTEYNGPLYIIIMDCDKTLYEEVPGYMSVGRYTYMDYTQFKCDSTVDRIFSGRNIKVSFSYR